TPNDVRGLLKSAIRDDNPVVFVENKLLYKTKGLVDEDMEYTIPLGKGDVKRQGTDITIIAYGRMVPRILKVAEEVKKEGINVEVIDPRTLVPLDKDLIIQSVIKTG